MASKHLLNNALPGADNLGDLLATVITLVNELKADFNAHRTQSGVHSANDTTNVVSSPDVDALGG